MLARRQSEPGRELAAAAKLLRVHHRSGDRARSQQANPAQARHALRARVSLRIACNFAIALGEVRLELAQVRQLPRHALAQRRRQRLVG